MVLVEDRNAVVPDGRALNFKTGCGLNRGDLVWWQVASEVVFAGKQAVYARGNFRNFHEADFLKRRTSAPIFVEGHECKRYVGAVFTNHVWAGGDGLARPVHVGAGFVP